GGPGTVGVVIQTLASLHPGIHQHICRACIKAAYAPVRAEYGDVGNAAQVEHHPCMGSSELCGMEGWHQGSTLASRSNVTAAEVGNHVDAAKLCEQGGSIQLDGIARPRAMTHRLAMRAHGNDVGCGPAAACQ